MLQVDVGTAVVKVVFQHFIDTTNGARCTVCDIYPADRVDPHPPEISLGKARCSAEDQFDKAIGRKIALQRALKDGNFTRKQRKLVWEAYWTKTQKR